MATATEVTTSEARILCRRHPATNGKQAPRPTPAARRGGSRNQKHAENGRRRRQRRRRRRRRNAEPRIRSPRRLRNSACVASVIKLEIAFDSCCCLRLRYFFFHFIFINIINSDKWLGNKVRSTRALRARYSISLNAGEAAQWLGI